MISFDEALALVLAEARPLETERVPLRDAFGRSLAEPAIAPFDFPQTNVSAMDGYAVREADLDRAPLRVVGQSFPSAGFTDEVPPGCCVRIFTGAPVPAGCDRVVIQEIVERQGDMAKILGEIGSSRFVRVRGTDFRAGDELVPAGRTVSPRVLLAAAGADLASLTVRRRPRVAVLATGDELGEPGSATGGAYIPDSASYGILGLVASREAACSRLLLPDDPERIAVAAAPVAEEADIIVITGGASVGEKDFAKAAFERLGLSLIFSKVAMRPGKPVWFGTLWRTLVLGLPGNPTSAMVAARLFLQPLLAALGGGAPRAELMWRRQRLAGPLPACDNRETFVRARVFEDGALPLGNQDSGAQKTLADADLLIRRRPQAPALAAGEMAEVIDF